MRKGIGDRRTVLSVLRTEIKVGGMRFVRKKKAWSEMTEAEVNTLKRKQCEKCVYFTKSQTKSVVSGICEYLAMEGHRRGCSPLDCVKRGIFKPKKKR